MVTPSRKTSSAGSLRDELATERAKLAGVAPQATKNDSDAQLRDRGTHTGQQAMSTITGLITALAAKATPADIATAIAALVASSPAALDTLDELAAALGDDPNFAATTIDALGNRLRLDASQTLTTGQKTQGQTNLGIDPATLDVRYARLADANAFAVRPTVVGAGAVETQNNKGVANGYPSLGADGLVLSSQLPVNGTYKGGWNASTNSPAIVAGVGTNGDEYTVTVAGTNSITGSSVSWGVGDRAKFTTTGNKWERIPSVQAINSVNGQTGIVVLTKSDVGLSNVDNTSDVNKPISTAQATALGNRLQFDAAQTLTTPQKTQGQTNLGVDPTTLDARYNRLSQVIADAQMQARIRADSTPVTDFSTAVENGWYRADPAATNAPNANFWLVLVSRYDTTIHQLAVDHQQLTTYRRSRRGSWSAWERVLSGMTELDARYAKSNDVFDGGTF